MAEVDLTSVLEKTEGELLQEGILVLDEVMPKPLRWMAVISPLLILAGVVVLIFDPIRTVEAVSACFLGVAIGVILLGVAVMRILLLLNRLFLMIQILAAQLPAQAARLIASGLNIPGSVISDATKPPPSAGGPPRR